MNISLERLKALLCKSNGGNIIQDPIYSFDDLTPAQVKQLNAGSGHNDAKNEIALLNSSTALGVNYYKAFEECQKITNPNFEVSFEWRESIPVTGSSAPANIDVMYSLGNTVYFIECKYLEPYYMKVKPNSAAYVNPRRMPIKEGSTILADMCREINNMVTDLNSHYSNFDAPQICRHLLAIFRYVKENPTKFEGKKLVLQSMSWRMTDKFISEASENGIKENVLKGIRDNINAEIKDYEQIINNYISRQELNWDCHFECKHYNDELSLIKNSSRYEQIISRYYL